MLVLAITSVSKVLGAVNPVQLIMQTEVGKPLATAFTVLAVFALWVNAMILQLAAARVMWAQARDGKFPFPHLFGKLNRERVPHFGICTAGVIAFAMTLYSSLFNVIIAILAIGFCAGYAVLLMVGLRAKLRGELPERPFRLRMSTPLYVAGARHAGAIRRG
jgi:amino acid transporter